MPVIPATDDPDAFTCIVCRETYARPMAGQVTRWDKSHTQTNTGTEGHDHDNVCPVEPPPVFDSDVDWHDAHVRPSRSKVEDPPRPAIVPQQAAGVPQQAAGTDRPESKPRKRSSFACWLLLSLGVALFACGGALIGFSLMGDREELWNVGTPLALAGQAAFLIGLVLQLDVIWHQSRLTSRSVSHLDDRLAKLQDFRESSEQTSNQPAHAFYQDMADGASPQVLLNDLKGQLDLLADKLTRSQQ